MLGDVHRTLGVDLKVARDFFAMTQSTTLDIDTRTIFQQKQDADTMAVYVTLPVKTNSLTSWTRKETVSL